MTQWQNLKVKASVGSVFPPSPGATFHRRPIPQGYVVVMVDEITEGFEELQLENATSDGETQVGLEDSMSMAEGGHQPSELQGSGELAGHSASSSSSGE